MRRLEAATAISAARRRRALSLLPTEASAAAAAATEPAATEPAATEPAAATSSGGRGGAEGGACAPPVALAVPVVPVGAGAFMPINAGPATLPLTPSLGTLLVDFLAFYGAVFDPKEHAILGSYGLALGAPPPGCGFTTRAQVGLLAAGGAARLPNGAPAPPERASDPFAMDPLVSVDPVDVHNNTAKSCYRVGQIQKLFARAATAAVAAAEAEAMAVRRGEQPRPARVLAAILAAEAGAQP